MPVLVGCIVEEFYKKFYVLLTPSQNFCHMFNKQNQQQKNGIVIKVFFTTIIVYIGEFEDQGKETARKNLGMLCWYW